MSLFSFASSKAHYYYFCYCLLQYLPAEMSRLSFTTWKNWRVWLCPWMLVKSTPPITDQRTRRNRGGYVFMTYLICMSMVHLIQIICCPDSSSCYTSL